MLRAEGKAKLELLLERLCAGEGRLGLIDALYVYGSYARGALEVGDLDLDIEIGLDDPRVIAIFETDEGMESFIDEIGGGDETISVAANYARDYRDNGFDLVLLYERGWDLERALAALWAIKTDANAASGRRDYMLPQFEGLEKTLVRGDRKFLLRLVEQEAIEIANVGSAQVARGAEASALGVCRLLREHEQVAWMLGGKVLVLTRKQGFGERFQEVLEEMNLTWYDLLWDDEEDA